MLKNRYTDCLSETGDKGFIDSEFIVTSLSLFLLYLFLDHRLVPIAPFPSSWFFMQTIAVFLFSLLFAGQLLCAIWQKGSPLVAQLCCAFDFSTYELCSKFATMIASAAHRLICKSDCIACISSLLKNSR